MLRTPFLAIALTAGLVPAVAADDTLPIGQLAAISDQLQHFGFGHVTELEAESMAQATVAGWRHPDWHSELTWNIETGQGLEEELEYGIDAPWGIAPTEIPRLVAWMTRNDKPARIESLEIERDGSVELEGEDHQGESWTWRARLEAFNDRH